MRSERRLTATLRATLEEVVERLDFGALGLTKLHNPLVV